MLQDGSDVGLWVHWGRVNTQRRIRHVLATGACHSLDGSSWARWRHTHLDAGLSYLAGAHAQLDLGLELAA